MAVTVSWVLEQHVLLITTTPTDFDTSLAQLETFLNTLFPTFDKRIDVIHDARALKRGAHLRKLLSYPGLQHATVRRSVCVPPDRFSMVERMLLRSVAARTRTKLSPTLEDAADWLYEQDSTLSDAVQNMRALRLRRLFATHTPIVGTQPAQPELKLLAKPTDDSPTPVKKKG